MDISFSLYRSVDCEHCKARTTRLNFDGHLNCRRHAPCNENKSGWWSRQNCQICETLWEQCLSGSKEVASIAKSSLKLWIRGYQKNLPGHYVREEEIKEFLFPTGQLPKKILFLALRHQCKMSRKKWTLRKEVCH